MFLDLHSSRMLIWIHHSSSSTTSPPPCFRKISQQFRSPISKTVQISKIIIFLLRKMEFSWSYFLIVPLSKLIFVLVVVWYPRSSLSNHPFRNESFGSIFIFFLILIINVTFCSCERDFKSRGEESLYSKAQWMHARDVTTLCARFLHPSCLSKVEIYSSLQSNYVLKNFNYKILGKYKKRYTFYKKEHHISPPS